MTNTSPAPAGWLASDGSWHPQRWESAFIYHTDEHLQTVIDEISRQTKALGEEGWEVMSSSAERTQVSHHFRDYDKVGDLLFEWTIVCALKRPLPPG
jgi:hypothetical protein